MVLSDICVRRPVLATVLSLVLTLVGIVYYSKLTLRHYPQVDRPIVAVTTQYEGASSEIIEGQVTKIIENALFGIQGLQYMSSRSLSEESKITLVFDINRNLDSAASDVRDRDRKSVV